MKKIISAIAVSAAAISINVQADGFAPWNNAGIESNVDREQAKVEIRSYYRANLNEQGYVPGEPQAAIKIAPWYDANRV